MAYDPEQAMARVALLLSKAGMKPSQLALKCELKRGAASAWKARGLPMENVDKIAEVLDANPAWIMYGDDYMERCCNLTPKQAAVLRAAEVFSDADFDRFFRPAIEEAERLRSYLKDR